uniref:Galactosyltransferase C-terminal domain-containing protein n=1 Tax=viral metagenome TaxID=1070528 RepID=A0A6C0BS13_9ZZZZ
MYDNIIIVPYRDRKEHLDFFKTKIDYFLDTLGINTLILIVEQIDGKEFNRGKLLNIGVKEYNHMCNNSFIFHDVDTFLNNSHKHYYNDNNDIVRIWYPHNESCGGICKFRKNVINDINGHPNNIWGWGIEDRALYKRSIIRNYKTTDYISSKNDVKILYHTPNIIYNYTGRKNEINNKVINILSQTNQEKERFITKSGINTLVKIDEYDFVTNPDNTILDWNEYIILNEVHDGKHYIKITVDI